MPDAIAQYLQNLIDPANLWSNLLEWAIIAPIVYAVLSFLQGTRGARLLQGVAILLIAGFLIVEVMANNLGLERLRTLYYPFTVAVLLTTVVVFQPELRRGLMQLGETRWLRRWIASENKLIEPIVASAAQLSKNKIGALIAIERDVGIGSIIDTGVKVDALLSADLLNAIFWPNAPLHDMGVIIRESRIAAAGCQFPLADSGIIDRALGSRHRAAVGLSLESDAVIIVVSEETGSISIAERGKLQPGLTIEALRSHLTLRFGGDAAAQQDSLKAA